MMSCEMIKNTYIARKPNTFHFNTINLQLIVILIVIDSIYRKKEKAKQKKKKEVS